jgi:uncharacterized protein
MRRRQFLALAGTAAAGIAVEGFALEPRRLAVTRQSLDLPLSDPLSFVQISDLHLQRVGAIHERIADAVREASPAFILITGDSVDRADSVPLLRDFLRLLPPSTPKYAILGNWEHWSGVDLAGVRRSYAEANGRLLVNESVMHGPIRITGLDDLIGGRPDLSAALGRAEPAAAHLLLCHCPAHRDVLASAATPVTIGGAALRRGIDSAHLAGAFVFSGHTHGGQVNLGGFAPMRPPGSGRYVAGWYRGGAAPAMYVSRGVGTSVLPVRLGSVPELTAFTTPGMGVM